MTSHDDLDVALGLEGFGRPKKRPEQGHKGSVAHREGAPTREEAHLEDTRQSTSVHTAVATPASTPRVGASSAASSSPAVTQAIETPTRAGLGPAAEQHNDHLKAEPNYGRLVTLRLPSALFERLELKVEELGGRSAGQLVVALIRAAVEDPRMLGPIVRDADAAKDRVGKDLVLALLRPTARGFTKQITIRLPRATYGLASAASKAAGERELAPYLVALVERQLVAL